MTGVQEKLAAAEEYWAGLLSSVSGETLDRPSGCDGWDNRALIDHVGGGGHRYAMLLAGASAADTATTRSNDYVGSDPVGEFWRYERLFRDALADADLDAPVDHRAGPRPGRELITMRVMELALHAYDLCMGLSQAWEPPGEVAEYLLAEAAPVIEELRARGMFGPSGVAASEAPADRLLAFAGRT